MNDATFKQLRVAVIGGCQITGLTATARLLLPGADVKGWHVGVHPKDSDDDLLTQLPGFDLVISQLSDRDEHVPLRVTRLRERGLPVIYLPVMVFPGFHPDITHVHKSGGLVPGLATNYHSLIVAAAFTLGLPQARVPGLFNTFVFSELGYFEIFEAAKTALFTEFDKAGYDLRPPFALWLTQVGQFMYTVNHPHIVVLATMCRLALARAGHLDAATPLPADIDDYLATHFIWPTYPALARRIGLPGSTTFLVNSYGLADGQTRELTLAEYVSACYRQYGGLETDALRVGDVAKACDRLGTLVVA
jgi:hypothetical protein